MKKKTIIIIAGLALLAAGTTWYFWPGKQQPPVHINTTLVKLGAIAKSITSTGTVEPEDTVSVGAQVSGVIQGVYADFNDLVKEKQLLAKVDPSIIQAQIEQVKATLANNLSNEQYQQVTFERQQKLFDLGAISKADFQLATNQYNMAKAAVENARAQLKLSEKNLYYTNIYSPINGTILYRNVSAGQTIASSFNAPTLFVIAKDLTRMQIHAAVDEADIGGVKAGQRASFTVDAFPDEQFTGRVKEVQLHPTVSSNVVTYATIIDVNNKDMKLKPGMTTNINIFIREDSGLLTIPIRAIQFKPDSATLKGHVLRRLPSTPSQNFGPKPSTVWVMHGDTLVETKIRTGLRDDLNVEVTEGLKPGDEVATGTGGGGSTSGNNQRSPFMPQMQRRQGSSPRTS